MCFVACMLVREDVTPVPGYENVVGRFHECNFKRLFRLSRGVLLVQRKIALVSAFYESVCEAIQQ